MFKTTIFLAISVAFIPGALGVRSTGDLAIGLLPDFLGRPVTSATLWDTNCDVLDTRAGTGLCGTYDEESTVICNGDTPASAQLNTGLDFGDCVPDNETCSPNGSVLFCCVPS